MRVLALTADYAPAAWSGIGVAVRTQAEALARGGHAVDVVTSGAARGRPGDRARVHALGRDRFPVRPDAFDIVHVHSLGLAEVALELRRRFRLPLVYTAHAAVHRELAGRADAAAWDRAQLELLAAADHVVFASAAEQRDAIARQPVLAARSTVVANGVERAAAASRTAAATAGPGGVATGAPTALARRGTGAVPSRGPVVFAGRFAATKGIALLGATVAALRAHPEPVFVLAGGHGDPPGRRAVQELVARDPGRCRTVGWLAPDALDRLFRRASMVVVPSRYEPFGLVALEAMRAGAPVLAAATGGLAEVVTADSGGRLVSSRRASDWAASILELWRSAELRTTLARRGPAYVAERFDADALAGVLVERVYRPLTGERA